MATYVKQGDIFGRIGTGLGQGLAEQLPKEMEHARLSAGLKKLGEESPNLSPTEFLTKAYSTYGITPQMVQSLGEAAKYQRQRAAYKPRSGEMYPRSSGESSPQPSPENARFVQDMAVGNRGEGANRKFPVEAQGRGAPNQNIPSNYKNEEQEALHNKPENVVENPLLEKFQPKKPWSQERLEDTAFRNMERDPDLGLTKAFEMAREEEAREMAMPEAERRLKEYNEETREKVGKEVDSHLETLLQKTGADIYSDLTGNNLVNLRKAAFNDLKNNPNLDEKAAGEKWAKKGLHLAQVKNEIRALANREPWDRVIPDRKVKTLKSLKAAQKIFAETGNSNEFFDMLRTVNKPPEFDEKGKLVEPGTYGFGLSSGGAALIAYPRSPNLKALLKENEKWKDLGLSNIISKSRKLAQDPLLVMDTERNAKSRKLAQDAMQVMTAEDSILATMRQILQVNPKLNPDEFLDYFSENQDKLPTHMKKELVIPRDDMFPNWGDLMLFPFFEKSVAND